MTQSDKTAQPGFITPDERRKILETALEAARGALADKGLEVTGTINDASPLDVGLSLTVRAPLDDRLRADFEVHAEKFGLLASDYGRVFPWGDLWWQVVGLNPDRPKNPVAAIMLPSKQSRWLPQAATWAIVQARHSDSRAAGPAATE